MKMSWPKALVAENPDFSNCKVYTHKSAEIGLFMPDMVEITKSNKMRQIVENRLIWPYLKENTPK